MADEYAARYQQQLVEVAGERVASTVAADDAAGALWRRMRTAELAGLDVDDVLREAVTKRELDTAESVAEVLAWRIESELKDVEATTPKTYVDRTPQRDDPVGTYTRQLAEAMDKRVNELGDRAAAEQPQWAEQLGPVPEDPLDRLAWSERAGVVASYREAYGYDRDDDAIGPAPGRGNVEARAAWHAAYSALGAPEDQRIIAARDDGELRNLVRDYEREEAWAPAFVDEELRETSLTAREYHAQAVFERAELEATAEPDEQARADAGRRLADLEALNEHLARRTAALEEIAQARTAWYAETARARELADQAKAELRRRGIEGRTAPVQEPVQEEPTELDRTEHTEPELVSAEQSLGVEHDGQEAADRRQEPPESVELAREELAEERATVEEQAREEPAEADRSERDEPEQISPDEVSPAVDHGDQEVDRQPEREPAPEPAKEGLTEARVQAELQRAREAADILAERQAERLGAEIEAASERDREYARLRDDDSTTSWISTTTSMTKPASAGSTTRTDPRSRVDAASNSEATIVKRWSALKVSGTALPNVSTNASSSAPPWCSA